uniref:Uncharacterized protein n=1 Tax=Anguilla anguilla TaxID=7936 RepID=A0A0E9QKK3_ANGAN
MQSDRTRQPPKIKQGEGEGDVFPRTENGLYPPAHLLNATHSRQRKTPNSPLSCLNFLNNARQL